MIVIEQTDGTFTVKDDAGTVVKEGLASHAEAWRFIDRYEGEPVNRSEKVSEWLTDNVLKS